MVRELVFGLSFLAKYWVWALVIVSGDGDFCSTFWTSLVWLYVPLKDAEAVSSDEDFVALGAVGVLPWMARNVSGVDVS